MVVRAAGRREGRVLGLQLRLTRAEPRWSATEEVQIEKTVFCSRQLNELQLCLGIMVDLRFEYKIILKLDGVGPVDEKPYTE